MTAKLVGVIEPRKGLMLYEYECIDCGNHFFDKDCNDRMIPYCGKCQAKQIKDDETMNEQKKDIDILRQIRERIERLYGLSINIDSSFAYAMCLHIIDTYLERKEK